jgi:hypothetical protein
MPSYLDKKRPFVLVLENETRKYVIEAKSRFDLEEWTKAIYSHIDTLSINKSLRDM